MVPADARRVRRPVHRARRTRPRCSKATGGRRGWFIVEFPSVERAQAWWNSPEYSPAKALRQATSEGSLILLKGRAESRDLPRGVSRTTSCARRSRALLGLHVVPSAAARGDGRDPRRPRLARRAADRRRQVALLPGAGARSPGPRRRRLAADLADEGSGRHARRQRRARRVLQQLAVGGRDGASVLARPARGALSAALRLARAAGRRGQRRLSSRCSARPASASSPSTRRTASASGATTSGPSTGSSARLRERFPGVSLHAYTATATARVRRDIVAQLGLRDPLELVGSFDRPNLRLPRAAARRR